MADTPSSQRDSDIVPDLPAESDIAAAYANTTYHSHNRETTGGPDAPPSPTLSRRPRRSSSASRVAIDFFDPQGVNDLRRTVTNQSGAARSEHQHHNASVSRHDDVNEIPTPIPEPESSSHSTVAVDKQDQDENFDLEKHLQDFVRRADDESIQRRELGVVFHDLRVQGLGAAASYQPTLGSTFNPTHIPEKIRQARHPPVRDILSGFEGVVRPGEMLLVLGSPGAGCSTFLKTLANQHKEYHAVSGTLHYSTFSPSEMHRQFRGDVVYCPEDDVHFPTLTVGETLGFAAKTRAPRRKARIGRETRAQYIAHLTGVLGTVFGLRHVRDTKVGNEAIRGVSGGEKKRVSIAEALATRAKIGCWDNSTRGLDSSTALEFVRALRIATDTMGLTTVVSIYQASELLYKLFDKVCVISAGRMVYFGRADRARAYFENMGYAPAHRQTTADFLVAVTDPFGRTLREGFAGRAPGTPEEMERYFRRSKASARNREEVAGYLMEMGHEVPRSLSLDSNGDGQTLNENYNSNGMSNRTTLVGMPSRHDSGGGGGDAKAKRSSAYIQSTKAERAKHTRPGSAYTISVPMQVAAVVRRRVQILKGDWVTQVIQIFSFIFQAIIMGTIFFKLPVSTSAYFSRGGVLFFALLFSALSAMAEIPALYAQRPIVSRHQKAAMYHPFAEALALTLVDVPITFATIIVFAVIFYFLTRLQQTASQFFIFFLFIFTMTLTMKAFFRSLAASFRKESSAQAVGGVCILVLVLYTGYQIPQPSMIGALRWLTYINPLRYGFEAIIANEFHTLRGTCATLVPSGPGYEGVALANQVCTTVGSVPGEATVNGNTFIDISYGYSYGHLWRNYGIIIAFTIGFIFILNVLTEMNSSFSDETSVVLFKRGSKPHAAMSTTKKGSADEEKGGVSGDSKTRDRHDNDNDNDNPQFEKKPSHAEEARETADALEAQPVMTDVFSWQHLRYTVPVGHGDTRQLLDDVSGYVAPGKLTALMGESGAGKTTLLNVLAQRYSTGVVTGDRFVNGQALPPDFQAQTGYCQQMDTHLAETTVREALLFSANLRQPASVPLAEKEAYVETCLKMCGLEHYADAIVGSLGVEHRKRTTIGVELAAKPRLLLFLDEPTSGLDSQSAWAIMAFLRDLADHGQAILCTIHQPSSELFQVFDRLLLLRKGGQTVYFGDLGTNASTLIQYFERNGARRCGEEENPAEWMLDVIGAGATATSVIDWYSVWGKSKEAAFVQEDIENIHSDGRQKPPVHAIQESDFATSWGVQVYFLLKRAFQSYWRNPTYLMAKLMLNVVGGLFIGFTFFKSKDTLQGTQNKLFAIFIATIMSVPLSNQLQVIFINLRNIYEVRERPSRMYSWTALVTTQILVEIPWNILGSTLFFLCWFWTVGFPSDRGGYSYLAYGIAFPLYYTTIAQAVAAMSPNAIIASILFSTLFSFVIAFNGVLQPFRLLGWWKWMYRVSPFTYLIEGLLGQAIGHREITCAQKEYVPVNPPSGQSCGAYLSTFIANMGGYVTNPDATSACQFCSARTTDQFLGTTFNIRYSHHWRDIGIVFGVTLFNVFAVFALTYLFRIHTGSYLGALRARLSRKSKK